MKQLGKNGNSTYIILLLKTSLKFYTNFTSRLIDLICLLPSGTGTPLGVP